MAIGCAILAAGAARRFGGLKLLADVGGVPLLARVVGQVWRARCDRIAVVLGANAAPLAATLIAFPLERLERLENDRWNEGMSSSVRVAANWARHHDLEALVLVVADQPSLDAGHIDALVRASQGGARLAASRYADVLGVPAVFPRSMFPQLGVFTGDRGARALLRDANADVVAVPWPAGEFDVDRREDVPSGPPSGDS
jgi:molybdenum cofactor cytidylyltransferase